MKRLRICLYILLLTSTSAFAQRYFYEPTFAGFTDYYSKQYGITFRKPENFIDLNRYDFPMRIRTDSTIFGGFVMGPIFKSKDNECILGFPELPFYISKLGVKKNYSEGQDTVKIWQNENAKLARHAINFEIKSALGYPTYIPAPPPKDGIKRAGPVFTDSTRIDLNRYITIIAGKKAKDMFNADSIFLYDLPLEKPFEEKYTHCTVLFIAKRDRAILAFRFFLTPAGKKKEQEYIDFLSGQVMYDEKFQAN
jgi:hypothetical protein